MYYKAGYILIVVLIQSTMGIKTMEEFFDINMGDLSVFTWDHAVNSELALNAALTNDKHMIECDIILSDGKPVMGHDAGDPYDLTLEKYLDRVIRAVTDGVRKGLKLDFKDTTAFNVALDLLRTKVKEINFPLWINGDIIKGPGGKLRGVNLEKFNDNTEYFKNTILSFGWTTGKFSIRDNYDNYVEPMLKLVETNYTTVAKGYEITYPVRAVYFAETSDKKILELIGTKNTLTLWSGSDDTDNVNIDSLKRILNMYKDKIYMDIPDDLKEKLIEDGKKEDNTLGKSAGGRILAGAISVALALLFILM